MKGQVVILCKAVQYYLHWFFFPPEIVVFLEQLWMTIKWLECREDEAVEQQIEP